MMEWWINGLLEKQNSNAPLLHQSINLISLLACLLFSAYIHFEISNPLLPFNPHTET